jgi:hypothetical protein
VLARELEYHDLEFRRAPVPRYSSRGTVYKKWVEIGVPKIPEVLLKTVFYLYPDGPSAEAGRSIGGTGFIASIPSQVGGHRHYYAVTNRHVAIDGGCSVIRLNTRDGGTDIIEFDPADWVKHPDGQDIAACPIYVDTQKHPVGLVPLDRFVTKELLGKSAIGPGEDVFMIGRFIDYDGGPANRPAVRFGNISVMPVDGGAEIDSSYIIDMHSRTGYSGSPVFVYRTPGSNFDLNTTYDVMNPDSRFMYFLGVHWGQFPEDWELIGNEARRRLAASAAAPDSQLIRGVSGMTLVCPAWHLKELLELQQFQEQRASDEQEQTPKAGAKLE